MRITNNLIFLMAISLPTQTGARQSKPPADSKVHSSENLGAEKVFENSGSKVVFLIIRSLGEVHARASGIILTPDGYIATNYHALEGADAVEIRFFPDPKDSDNYQSFNGANLLYSESILDIAVLKVNSKGMPFLDCAAGTACVARIGESVYALGNPKGLSNSISQGIVSGLRSAGGEDLIQHTAAISPGSSGGALLDSRGNLLGMNSWQVADGQNLNFAISGKHLLEALVAAQKTTTTLKFPPENVPPSAGKGNTVASKDKAMRQMRRIVEAIKQCPEVFSGRPIAVANKYQGPPSVLEWDVLASDSVRSPLQGYVRFNVPSRLEETDEAKRSQKLDHDYHRFVQALGWFEQDNHHSPLLLKYRYEFDLGSDAPELRRALWDFPFPRTTGPTGASNELKEYQPPAGSCWDNVARSPASAIADHGEVQ